MLQAQEQEAWFKVGFNLISAQPSSPACTVRAAALSLAKYLFHSVDRKRGLASMAWPEQWPVQKTLPPTATNKLSEIDSRSKYDGIIRINQQPNEGDSDHNMEPV